MFLVFWCLKLEGVTWNERQLFCYYFILKQDFLFYNLFDGTQLQVGIESSDLKVIHDVILLPPIFPESNIFLSIAVKNNNQTNPIKQPLVKECCEGTGYNHEHKHTEDIQGAMTITCNTGSVPIWHGEELYCCEGHWALEQSVQGDCGRCLLPWRHSKAVQMQTQKICSRGPCFSREVGTDDLQRPLLTQPIQWSHVKCKNQCILWLYGGP